ncbi:hypothetical protein [Xylella fastidiosa]|uniref:Transposase n=1 Tax=Xylella fastidiosa TaxID=2371 RepID=A0ABD7BXQ2_XYLFS|nr:hypothetical protein [Xylella fastidiosa]MDG5823163.1 hypothetical protein [Xylella fastidiosa subsp. pauca]MDG5826434.1 hypothetical protein [Xylella fastidiosa subsp. pauca]QPB72622.1 hypothetical protein XFHB_14030 [Xylella fastidiosa]
MAGKRSDLADSATRFRTPEGRALFMVCLLVAMRPAQCSSNSAGQFKEGIQKSVLWGRCHRVRWPVGNSKSLSQEGAPVRW